MAGLRTNFLNDGRAFERELEMTCAAYRRLGVATIEKVEPPVRVMGGGKKVVFLANPFPDFVGCWTARGGRALFIEAKSTREPRLSIGGEKGLTATQLTAMARWRAAGACVVLLWQHAGSVELHVPDALQLMIQEGVKSLRFGDGLLVKRGIGVVIWDFLHPLAVFA